MRACLAAWVIEAARRPTHPHDAHPTRPGPAAGRPHRPLAGRRQLLPPALRLLRVPHRLHAVERGAGHRRDERRHGAGRASSLDRAAAGRPGQDVPAAQVARHQRAGALACPLVDGARHQVDGGMGLAHAPGAAAAACRRPGGRLHARALDRVSARPGRGPGRVGLLRGARADRAGAGQALPLSPFRQDPHAARRRVPGAGLARRRAPEVGVLEPARRLGGGPAAGCRRRRGRPRAGRPHRRAAARERKDRVAAALSRAGRAREPHQARPGLARACRGPVRLRHLARARAGPSLHDRLGLGSRRAR